MLIKMHRSRLMPRLITRTMIQTWSRLRTFSIGCFCVATMKTSSKISLNISTLHSWLVFKRFHWLNKLFKTSQCIIVIPDLSVLGPVHRLQHLVRPEDPGQAEDSLGHLHAHLLRHRPQQAHHLTGLHSRVTWHQQWSMVIMSLSNIQIHRVRSGKDWSSCHL